MTQEEKELLIKDLCARLPYGVKVRYSSYKAFITCTLQAINPVYDNVDLWCENACFNPISISKIKPYLIPLSISSMTEEQKEDMVKSSCGIGSDKNVFDWYNKNHFDYRGLIPMGLAIEAPEGMYN